jgi:hypothetical protein
MKALILMAALIAPPALAQGYSTLPDGETVFSPQPNDLPVRQYYAPQGGPPVGNIIATPDVDVYVQYRGGTSFVTPRER